MIINIIKNFFRMKQAFNLPVTRVFEFEGEKYTLDNVQLAALQKAGYGSIPIQCVDLNDWEVFKEVAKKFKPIEAKPFLDFEINNETRMTNFKKKNMNLNDFQKYSVWTWDNNMNYFQPILEKTPDPNEYSDLFIRAIFKSSTRFFNGYLMGGEWFYGFSLFVDSEEVVFNKFIKHLNRRSFDMLFAKLNSAAFELFPLEYESDVSLKGKKSIAGVFSSDFLKF